MTRKYAEMQLVLIFGDKAASEQFHFSIDASLNFSSLNGYEDGETILGINYGVGAHLKLSDRWSLVTEFKPFSTKGATNIETPIELTEGFADNEVKQDLKDSFQGFDFGIPLEAGYKLILNEEKNKQLDIGCATALD